MINLTSNFTAAKPIADVRKFEVVKVRDFDTEESSPTLLVQVALYGQSSNPWPGNPFNVYIRNTVASYVMTINATPTGLTDQFLPVSTVLSGAPYTTLTDAYYAATGKTNMRKAVENLLVTVGALPAQFAGT